MDCSHQMVSISFKHTFKYKDSYTGIEAQVALFVNDGETVEQTQERARNLVKAEVDKQIADTLKSLKQQ